MHPTHFLNWSKHGPDGPARVLTTPERCCLCGRPTLLRSPRGKACHKVCAEAWLKAHNIDTTNQALPASTNDEDGNGH
jgi:hypothetical protein